MGDFFKVPFSPTKARGSCQLSCGVDMYALDDWNTKSLYVKG